MTTRHFTGRAGPPGSGAMEHTVTVDDGKPLNPRLDLRKHSPDGFAWGYGGSGPAQLSLALLIAAMTAEETAPRDMVEADRATWVERVAEQLYQDFKFKVVARWAQDDGWSVSSRWVVEAAMHLPRWQEACEAAREEIAEAARAA